MLWEHVDSSSFNPCMFITTDESNYFIFFKREKIREYNPPPSPCGVIIFLFKLFTFTAN